VTLALPEVTSAMPGLVPPRPPRRQRRVWVRGPLGTGWDLEPAVGGDLLLVAGGDGLASLLPVLADTVDYPTRHPRAVLLLPAGPASEMPFRAGRALRGAGVPACRIQVSFQSRIRCRDGSCGRCGVDGLLPCRDGPVIGYDRLAAT
jgi:anaerobic sulfite reductase subunit B